MIEISASDAFIAKWLKKAKEITGEQQNTSDYWNMTPSRVYWTLLFEVIAGWDAVNMAEDLLKLYTLEEAPTNEAIKHAKSLVISTR